MFEGSGLPCRSAAAQTRLGRAGPVLAAALALLLSACAARGPTQVATPAVPEVPSDPVLAFAAGASPGAATQVTLPEGGQRVQLRMTRAYNAASGRECREVQQGNGSLARTRIICSDGTRWAEARPLLRGGATARP